jgi:hypothetical protein
VLGFVVNLVVVLVGGAEDWQSEALETALLWLVGVNGVILASGHLLAPTRTAASNSGARLRL